MFENSGVFLLPLHHYGQLYFMGPIHSDTIGQYNNKKKPCNVHRQKTVTLNPNLLQYKCYT